MGSLEAVNCSVDDIFRTFSACKGDAVTLILDVRPSKEFARLHVLHSFSVRASANGAALLDYSKAAYDHQSWSDACWWDRDCLVLGPPGLRADHPVPAFLLRDGHARSVRILKEGFDTVEAAFPFLCTPSLKTNAAKVYPSQLDPGPGKESTSGRTATGNLYLGDWAHAEAHERLAELGVRSVLTIHNNPERLRLPPGVSHLRVEMADVESEDIAPWLLKAHEFIEGARQAGQAVLVHCGAGVSRSATLCIAHLMQRHGWRAQRALEHVQQRRRVAQPNGGFWAALCALEAELGLADRGDAAEPLGSGAHRLGHPTRAAAASPLGRADVRFVAAGEAQGAAKEGVQWGEDRRGREPEEDVQRGEDRRGREPKRRRSTSRSRHRRSSRSRSRDRGRRRAEGQPAREERRPPRAAPVDEEGCSVLEVSKGGTPLGRLVLPLSRPSQECLFGRLPSCSVPLDHLSVSRSHAKLTTDGAGALFVTDLGSAHGTNVDGAWIRPQAPKQLREGSVLRFGASTREYRVAKLPEASKRV